MYLRCYSIHSISRRRNYFFHAILVILCISSFLALKKTKANPSSSIHTHTVSTFQNISTNKTALNCVGDPLKQWCKNQVQLCNSSLTVYNRLFVLTRAITLQPQYAKGKRIGGEDIQTVLNQPEQNEYFQFEKDFIRLSCKVENIQENIPNSHLSSIFSSLTTYETQPVTQIIDETTIAVNRRDYANFYHTITDLYTVYLLCCFFRRDPKSVRILFLDAHPKGNLDILWSHLFHSYTRLGELKALPSIFYRELIWSQPQSHSEIDIQRYRRSAPSCFIEFREHVLTQFNISYKENEQVNCQALNVFFLVRHNYVAHPRNPSGKITRQLTNEQQILDDLKIKFSKYRGVNFSFNHFEESSIEQQLNVISQTDIFIGVHGAGLTHVLFMKPNRCLVELATLLWESQHHFELMASINSINYRRCLITDGSPETSQTIFECVKSKIDRMCSLAPVQNDAQPIFTALSRINGSISNSKIV
ncbi:unnamed protein product [Rotaria magnacalcarata]|uniref:EGF domain-specific O-linked N-acetylglucosamine transferase n=1 Tax=Rotaria magnacalcarata TaxID=392030 RepID=A0A816PSL9_9BILA|nr:unnamed protein product [Rotaria magnacalcarata]